MEKILVHTAWGPTDPTRAGIAFAYASACKKQGMDVNVFLFGDAVLLAVKRLVPQVVPIGPPLLKDTLGYLVDQGVKIYACKPCYEERGLDAKELVPTGELKGMDMFVELSKTSKVVGF